MARREHSESELRQKLGRRGLDSDAISLIVAQLKEQGLQSDRRFAGSYIHSREHKGYGPRRIAQELRARGVAAEIIEGALAESAIDWSVLAAKLREKKFGPALPVDYAARMKQSNFLNYRGFTSEQIRAVFDADRVQNSS